jgi:hypothetical protein
MNSGSITFSFECGCFANYWADGNRLQGGLSCCAKHEAAYQKIEKIVPLTMVKVMNTYQPANPPPVPGVDYDVKDHDMPQDPIDLDF